MQLGSAYAIATCIYTAGKNQQAEDKAAVLYSVVDGMDASDEWKADLYAQLEEKLTADTKFADAVVCICASIHHADWRIPHGRLHRSQSH